MPIAIAQQYIAEHGDAAPLAFARDLMRGDAATFKAGYSLENAVLATVNAFALGPHRTDWLRDALQPSQEPWAYRGATSSAASRGRVLHSADCELSPDGAREVARRLLAAADDADRQRATAATIHATKPTRDRSIFAAFEAREDWGGWGYLGARKDLTPDGCRRLDEAVLRAAHLLKLTDEQLFLYCDSRPGRHLAYGDEADVEDAILDARALASVDSAVDHLMIELGSDWYR